MKTSGRTKKQPRKITPQYLHNVALAYLERFSASTASLRRVLMRRVAKSSAFHGTDPAEGASMVERLITRLVESGLLDDAAYARARAETLRRRGDSRRSISARLRAKGLETEHIEDAIAQADEETGEDAEYVAALALAKRRKLGPFRMKDRAAFQGNDLATLARAGFSFDIAKRVLNDGS